MTRPRAILFLVLFAVCFTVIGCELAQPFVAPVFRELESYPKPPKATTRHVDTYDASTGSLMLKGAIPWSIAADLHGNKANRNVVRAFFKFHDYFNPPIRIILGDLFNFAALRKNASDQERRESMDKDIAAGLKFIERYKPTHFLRGNHDERLWDALKSDHGETRDYARKIIGEITAKLGDAKMYKYDKRKGILRLGDYLLIHGYHTGLTAARNAAMIYGNVIMGHVHADDHASVPGLHVKHGYTCACLCQVDQDYNRAQVNTLRQSNGWPYGWLLPNGKLVVQQARKYGSSWVAPVDMKAL